jgi:predicted dehydrogenase
MRRVRIGIIGAGAITEWAILPVLSGPDATAAPDTGAWWGRRAAAHSEIRYQAPARPEVVALSDTDEARARRVAEAARVRAVYTDWRLMLREVELDALLCIASPEIAAEVATAAGAAVRWLWIDGPPAPAAAAVSRLWQRLEGRAVRVWCASPLRQAAAHRAARRLLERDQIGTVSALTLRWGVPLHVMEEAARGEQSGDAPYLASSYAALDTLLSFALSGPGAAGQGYAGAIRVLAQESGGATSLWMQFGQGATATALFAAGESWSTPLPRLEICGTQGRSIVCEAGRRLWLYEPREAARLLEPPGLAAHVSSANIVGLAEDLKAFLAACVEEPSTVGATSPGITATDSLIGAARPLQVIEAANESLVSGNIVEFEPMRARLTAVERPAASVESTANENGSATGGTSSATLQLPL